MGNQILLAIVSVMIWGIILAGCYESTNTGEREERTKTSAKQPSQESLRPKTGGESSRWAPFEEGRACIAVRDALQSLSGDALLANLRKTYETYRQESEAVSHVLVAFSSMLKALENGESGSEEIDKFFGICSSTLGVHEQPPTLK